jgi:hypothetical protein
MPWPLHEHPSNVVAIFTSFERGYRLVDGEDLLDMANLLFSTREDVEGGTDAEDATPLKTFISQVVDGATVVLPPGLPGRYVWVYNDSANPIQVYGTYRNILTSTQDMIADSSNAQAIMATQDAGTVAEYLCFAPGLWKQVLGSTGSAPGPEGGIPEAPLNGITYGRMNGAWVPVLPLSGGTMTGPLILAPGTPTDPNQAISLSYIQNLHIDEGIY